MKLSSQTTIQVKNNSVLVCKFRFNNATICSMSYTMYTYTLMIFVIGKIYTNTFLSNNFEHLNLNNLNLKILYQSFS